MQDMLFGGLKEKWTREAIEYMMTHLGVFCKWLVPLTMMSSFSNCYTLVNILAAWRQVGLIDPQNISPVIPLSKLPMSCSGSTSSSPPSRHAHRVPEVTTKKGGSPPAAPVARLSRSVRGCPTGSSALAELTMRLSNPAKDAQPNWSREEALVNTMRIILQQLSLSVYGGAVRDATGGYWEDIADIDVACPSGTCSYSFIQNNVFSLISSYHMMY